MIEKQISAIAPEIIINCSKVGDVFDDLRTEESRQVGRFRMASCKNGLIIDAYHPNQKTINHPMYFQNIWDCINQKR